MNCKKSIALVIPLLLMGMSVQVARADDPGHVTASVGADYSAGKYGTPFETDIWDVPLSVGYQADRWSVKLTVPFISISGANNVIPGIGRVLNLNPHARGHGLGLGVGVGGTGAPTVTSGSASGLGDVVAQASYGLVRDDAANFGLDVTGKIKFGTADENKGLGTGKNDYGLGLGGYKGFGAWTLFADAGYTKYGSSTYIPLHGGWNGDLGAGYKLDGANTIGAYYYYREKISDSGYQLSEGTAYWDHKFGDSLRLQAYALAGFSNGSPDWGAGANVRYSF
ncbi:MAG TPA: transporter [Rhodanobacteraceae bacterium]|nr:transporter [Rhodanobacteraceae bacterium]